MTAVVAPTSLWRAAAPPLPPLTTTAADIAERLLLLVHFTIDWEASWLANYRPTYWDHHLPARVTDAVYTADTLSQWWSQVATELVCRPRDTGRRLELAELLDDEHSDAVLEVLRDQLPALLLRVQIIADAVRSHKQTNTRARPQTTSRPRRTGTKPPSSKGNT